MKVPSCAKPQIYYSSICRAVGGSYLGVEFVNEALRRDISGGGAAASEGRRLRFLANVDPVDVARALEGLDPETTLVVVISKTFTTAGEEDGGSCCYCCCPGRPGAAATHPSCAASISWPQRRC